LRIPSALVVARSNSKGVFVFKITMEKKCTKCGEVKSLDEFGNEKKGKNGKSSRCKYCAKEYSKTFKKNNPEKIKEINKKYSEKNKENIKDYREANKEKSKQYSKDYYKQHAIEFKEKYKDYRYANKEKIDQYKKDYYKLNKVRLNEKSKKYGIENKDKLKLANKKYREKLRKHKRDNISTLEFINLFQDNNGLRKCNKCQVVKSLDEDLMEQIQRELHQLEENLDFALEIEGARTQLTGGMQQIRGTQLLNAIKEKPFSALTVEEKEMLKKLGVK
jgi:hypothetical protein